MPRTRMTAAAAAAALVLGGAIAGADDDTANQTVTVTVTALPLTLSLADASIGFSVPANTDLDPGEDDYPEGAVRTSAITFHNPTGSGIPSARITVTPGEELSSLRDGEGRDLELRLLVADDAGYTPAADIFWDAFTNTASLPKDLATGISQGDAHENKVLTWSLVSLSGNPADEFTVGTFTFVIGE